MLRLEHSLDGNVRIINAAIIISTVIKCHTKGIAATYDIGVLKTKQNTIIYRVNIRIIMIKIYIVKKFEIEWLVKFSQ